MERDAFNLKLWSVFPAKVLILSPFNLPPLHRGIWNVPHISLAYLINASIFNTDNQVYNFRPLSYHDENVLAKTKKAAGKEEEEVDPDMHFCRVLRENGVFMYVSNLPDFGHLARLETYDLSRKNPDFYEIYSNEIDWRRRYIHENYTRALLNETIIEQPCPDVYWFPIGSPLFCKHLIGKVLLTDKIRDQFTEMLLLFTEIMENFGQWSGGNNYVSIAMMTMIDWMQPRQS